MTLPQSFGADLPTAPTALDGLLADLHIVQAQHETDDYPIPTQPGWEIRVSRDVDYATFRLMSNAAVDPMLGGVNDLQVACALIAQQCRAILRNGEPITDDGKFVTFDSPALMSKLGVSRPQDAVKVLFGKDPHVISTYRGILTAAGWGQPDAVPTKRSATG